MPPKAKITKEMIIDSAFAIARTEGAETINARTIAQSLSCSTQPVLYYFSKIEDIKKAVYAKTDAYHALYLTDHIEDCDTPMLEIGLRYIRFAHEEKHLFRFLFQSGKFAGKSLSALMDTEELKPILDIMQKTAHATETQAKNIFLSVFLLAHGYASLLANNSMEYNSMEYDEKTIISCLNQAYLGAVYAFKENGE